MPNGPDESQPLHLLAAARPYVAAALHCDLQRPLVLITGKVEKARQLYEELGLWSPEPDAILRFAEPEVLSYERAAWSPTTIEQRLRALAGLIDYRPHPDGAPPLIVTSARALLSPTLPVEEYLAARRTLRKGQRIELSQLLEEWVSWGYEPVSVVQEPGTFSRRGGIVDVFPPAASGPVRIELFGDEVDSLRVFDPSTQRSRSRTEQVTIGPASEALPRQGPRAAKVIGEWDMSSCHEVTREDFEEDREHLEQGEGFPGLEFYIPYLYPHPGQLLDYLPTQGLILLDDEGDLEATVADFEREALDLRESLTQAGELPQGALPPYWTWDHLREMWEVRPPLILGYQASSSGDSTYSLHDAFLPGERYGGQLRRLLDVWEAQRDDGTRIVALSRQAERLAELWKERGEHLVSVEAIAESPPPGSLRLLPGTLAEGWTLRQGVDNWELILQTDAELFGWARPEPRRVVRHKQVTPETIFADLSSGDYVVHVEHGIGVFRGLVHLTINGVEGEYLRVDYAQKDKLYVPIHSADRLSPYVGADDREPTIHRLGSTSWKRVKERAQRAVEELARDLLELYSTRKVAEGHAFSPDTPWQRELEASFPYYETEAQLQAIREVKADMEKAKPMDRLVCGDVGYGKTEVALRAAFKAVMDHKQVAVLVPTTVLAQQHFQTFHRRLESFPIKVEMLSRFRSRKEQRQILQGLESGRVDIVIGTHRLLQPDVAFNDLGLLIIDEEQRFGVTHKEHLKQKRREIDVLTMTATPIPRTLHMSLTGVRDISIIDTPPQERVPIQTHVGLYDESLVRKAILREVARGGQVYFVHNRVRSIDYMAGRVSELVPEVIIGVAHGQMRERDLEQRMSDFVEGYIDVLVCTSIIESGLDIPNVNTIIIHRADRFGLAQLYQLRGRVGRGAVQAYAYLFHPRHHQLTEEARQRLETIREASELGMGFNIAMRDLEIRGAGEILGRKQHGHISAIGFDLYTRLLAQAVRELKGEEMPELVRDELAVYLSPLETGVQINLPLKAYLPDDYVPQESLRLKLYRRMAHLRTPDEVEDMGRELEDRFGQRPEVVENLLLQIRLKVLASRAGVKSIYTDDGSPVSDQGQAVVLQSRLLGRDEVAELRSCLGADARVGRQQIRISPNPSRAWQELERVLRILGTRK
ncbi:MAG: transcription-repair coupling factor [Chloroflexota bacterium]|nr:transcription-repair coupling factor [Chloroflexota bacterium]